MEDSSQSQGGRLCPGLDSRHVQVRLHASCAIRRSTTVTQASRVQHYLIILRWPCSPSGTDAHGASELPSCQLLLGLSTSRPLQYTPSDIGYPNSINWYTTSEPRSLDPVYRPLNGLRSLWPFQIHPTPPNMYPFPRSRQRTEPLRPDGPRLPPPPTPSRDTHLPPAKQQNPRIYIHPLLVRQPTAPTNLHSARKSILPLRSERRLLSRPLRSHRVPHANFLGRTPPPRAQRRDKVSLRPATSKR